jgi:hypothetical protein
VSSELQCILNEVFDERSLLKFVRALVADRMKSLEQEKETPSSPYGPDAGGSENTTIEGFLKAAAAWAETTKFGITQESALVTNPWRRFAIFLYCGKIYEC